MEAKVERLETAVSQLEATLEKANSAEERLMCQYDTMSQLFFEKEKAYLSRMDEMEKRNAEEKAAMRAAEEVKDKRHYKVLLTVSLVLLLIIGSLVGGIVYLVSNYDIAVDTYQSVSAEGGGNATIEDGIRYNQNPVEESNAR